MRIAIMGTGGMGGYLGAKLSRAGHAVAFVARGEHLAAIRERGLRVSGEESIALSHVEASDDPKDFGAVDAILFCVKSYDTDAAAVALAPILGPETFLVTVQNGVDCVDRIAAQIGPGRTLGGAAFFPANIAAPGEIAYVGRIAGKPHIAFGEPDGGPSERALVFAAACTASGIDAEVCADTALMLWEKFCLVAGTSATTALARQPVGVVRSDPDIRWMLAEAISETARVARAAGVALADDVEAKVLTFIDSNPPHGKASQLIDLERGRRLELESLSGTVVRLGRQLGVPTPVHATVYAALKPYRNGAFA